MGLETSQVLGVEGDQARGFRDRSLALRQPRLWVWKHHRSLALRGTKPVGLETGSLALRQPRLWRHHRSLALRQPRLWVWRHHKSLALRATKPMGLETGLWRWGNHACGDITGLWRGCTGITGLRRWGNHACGFENITDLWRWGDQARGCALGGAAWTRPEKGLAAGGPTRSGCTARAEGRGASLVTFPEVKNNELIICVTLNLLLIKLWFGTSVHGSDLVGSQ